MTYKKLVSRNWIVIIGLSHLNVRTGLSKLDWKNGYFGLSYINLNCK